MWRSGMRTCSLRCRSSPAARFERLRFERALRRLDAAPVVLVVEVGDPTSTVLPYGCHTSVLLPVDDVLDVIRRELRRTTPGLKVESDEIRAVVTGDVIKREILEGEKAVAAQRQVARAGNRMLRKAREDAPVDAPAATPVLTPAPGQRSNYFPAQKCLCEISCRHKRGWQKSRLCATAGWGKAGDVRLCLKRRARGRC